MTLPLKSTKPDFELFMDIRVAQHPIRHKIGVAWKSLNGDDLTLNFDGTATIIIALPVIDSTDSYIDTEKTNR